MASVKAQETQAKKVGRLDAVLSFVSMFVGIAGVELLAWAIGALPFLDSYNGGKYAWLKVPLGILLGAVLKGIDRKKHEDPSDSTGLVNVAV